MLMIRVARDRALVAAFIAAASPLALATIEVRGVLAPRDEDAGSRCDRANHAGASAAARITRRPFMRGGIPLIRDPHLDGRINPRRGDDRRHVLGIEIVAEPAAVPRPEMKEMQLDRGPAVAESNRKRLPVERRILRADARIARERDHRRGHAVALAGRQQQRRDKFLEQRLLEPIGESVAIEILGGRRYGSRKANGDERRSHAGYWSQSYSSAMNGYLKSVGGAKVSFTVRALTQRTRFIFDPALSFVPDARAPPNGCWPTTAPVGLSLM